MSQLESSIDEKDSELLAVRKEKEMLVKRMKLQTDKAEKGLAALEEEKKRLEQEILEEKEARVKLEAENKELGKTKNKTNSQIEEGADPEERSGVKVELEEEEILGKASKRAQEAATTLPKTGKTENVNLQKSRPQKRKASETGANLLISQKKQHKMFLAMIECGLSQLIEDEDTPVTMLGSLKSLKHYTTFSSEEKDTSSKRKKRKFPKIEELKQEDQEYFEQDQIKSEPVLDQDDQGTSSETQS